MTPVCMLYFYSYDFVSIIIVTVFLFFFGALNDHSAPVPRVGEEAM